NAGVLTVTAPASDGKYYAAAGTATLLVSDGAERTITETLALECPAYAAPEALGITFAQPAAFTEANVSQNIGFTTTGAVAFVKALNVPAGWTIAVSPLSGNAGTFTITAPGTPAADVKGEALILAADAAGKSVVRTLNLLLIPTHAASTHMWTFGEQTWSDAIHIPECNKDDFSRSDTEPQCRSYTEDANTWYYYNWPYVNQHAAILCPSPWRVPTIADYNELNANAPYEVRPASWWVGGYVSPGGVFLGGRTLRVWALDAGEAYYELYLYDCEFCVVDAVTISSGLQVRCVQ
ncbi:MAG: hypothetical protein LBN98_02515, partial [Prevotellaceae bacterium]|nr:hypothetical protein [Prevotellaceae bacterium]